MMDYASGRTLGVTVILGYSFLVATAEQAVLHEIWLCAVHQTAEIERAKKYHMNDNYLIVE
jgi:hypothetical protein